MLQKGNRLLKEKDFENVFKKGFYKNSSDLTIKLVSNELDFSRFGIIVSVKVSQKAVLRNKVKRRLREILRLNITKIKQGYDIVIILRKSVLEKNYPDLERQVLDLIKKAGLYEKNKNII